MEKFKQEAVWTAWAEWDLASVDSDPSSTTGRQRLIHGTYQLCGSLPLGASVSLLVSCTWRPHVGPEQLVYWAVLSPTILVTLRADRQCSRPQEAEQ